MKSLYNAIRNKKRDIGDRISLLGRFIDHALDNSLTENLKEAIEITGEILSSSKEDLHCAQIQYFMANAYSGIRMMESKQNSSEGVPWEDANLENELINLRNAFKYFQQGKIRGNNTDLEFRIATNFGNALNHIGRFSEAIEYWDYALSKFPTFAMAIGNRGYGLYYYSSTLYDPGHQTMFLLEAKDNLEQSLNGYLKNGARTAFEKALEEINIALRATQRTPLREYSLGKTKRERSYRTWVLANRLFLNPLNDIGQHSIAATDILTLPPIVTDFDEPPQLYGLYNQIKQEFVSARFLLYEGVKEKRNTVHFSDRKVLLYNTLDYPVYGISIEKLKNAFISSYSLLDKIAFLLNHYLGLQIPEEKISFRNFWYKGSPKNRKLGSEFSGSKNWPLRGLFWLSKDFYEKDTGFKDSIEPDAKELNNLRNHIVHKYLKVHDELLWLEDRKVFDPFMDKLSHSIKRDELERKTLKLLKLVRSALIYSALGIHFNEFYKKTKRDNGMVISMPLSVIKDDWKV